MNILVTGAAGFIGSHLCQRLLKLGHTVLALDNFDSFYDPRIKRQNLSECLNDSDFHFIEGDIRDEGLLDQMLRKKPCQAIIHLAAKAGVRPSIEDPIGYQDVNVRGTTVLLEAARKQSIGTFLFASSSSVYGNNEKVPFSETDPVDLPISPYAATKKSGELICYTYHHLYEMNINCLRFFTVYGPRQRPDLAIHKFARLIRQDKPLPVYGDGSMMRDFTFIEDILDGVIAALESCRGYEIYNLGHSNPIRLDHLIAEIETALGKKAILQKLSVPPGDVKRTYADIQKAKSNLGYQPRTELAEGLKQFVQWLDTQGKI